MSITIGRATVFLSPAPKELIDSLWLGHQVLALTETHRSHVAFLTVAGVDSESCYFVQTAGVYYPYELKARNGSVPIDCIKYIAQIGHTKVDMDRGRPGRVSLVDKFGNLNAYGVYGKLPFFIRELAGATGLKQADVRRCLESHTPGSAANKAEV